MCDYILISPAGQTHLVVFLLLSSDGKPSGWYSRRRLAFDRYRKNITGCLSAYFWYLLIQKAHESKNLFQTLCIIFYPVAWISFPIVVNSLKPQRIDLGQRSTSRLPIETQTLKISHWNDLDLGITLTTFMTLTTDKGNQVKLMPR